jgi:hypothetical protein
MWHSLLLQEPPIRRVFSSLRLHTHIKAVHRAHPPPTQVAISMSESHPSMYQGANDFTIIGGEHMVVGRDYIIHPPAPDRGESGMLNAYAVC